MDEDDSENIVCRYLIFVHKSNDFFLLPLFSYVSYVYDLGTTINNIVIQLEWRRQRVYMYETLLSCYLQQLSIQLHHHCLVECKEHYEAASMNLAKCT